MQVDLGALGTWKPEVVMTLAQWCEIACMAASPFLLARLGVRKLMLIGLAGWVLRNAMLFAGEPALVVALALPMHGWSYAFFSLIGSHFVDREAPAHLRAGTQALVTFCSSGPAVILGNYLAGRVVAAHRAEGVTEWSAVWLVPLVGYVIVFVVFAALFRNLRKEAESAKQDRVSSRKPRRRVSLFILCALSPGLDLFLGCPWPILQVQVGRGHGSRERAARH